MNRNKAREDRERKEKPQQSRKQRKGEQIDFSTFVARRGCKRFNGYLFLENYNKHFRKDSSGTKLL